jgi:HAE1 family hydrophobic/amphiphilic exporter-1
VPVFDGSRAAGRVAQARAQHGTAVQDRAALENQIRLEVQAAYDDLRLAERTFEAAGLNVAQARRALEMTEANYQFGAATPLDVVDAQAALNQAESIRNEAQYSHADARARLRYVVGRDPLEP